MPVETSPIKIDKEKKDEKSLVEHLVELRKIVSMVMSGDIETASGASSTVGSRRFDPQNQTTRTAVVNDDSSSPSDDSTNSDDD